MALLKIQSNSESNSELDGNSQGMFLEAGKILDSKIFQLKKILHIISVRFFFYGMYSRLMVPCSSAEHTSQIMGT